MPKLQICVAQLNAVVGDIEANTQKIIESIQRAKSNGANLVVFPELAVCGYPPEDLLLRESMPKRVARALQTISEHIDNGIVAIVGYPRFLNNQLFNTAGVITQDGVVAEYNKQKLPNYRVFDEKRYFREGSASLVVELYGCKVGLLICEDLWHPGPAQQAKEAGAELLISLNVSPWHSKKFKQRADVLAQRVNEVQLPLLYACMVGAQDELVFDGASLALGWDASLQYCAPSFEASADVIEYDTDTREWRGTRICQPPEELAATYQALVLGLRDYVHKNRFPSVILGLSGGIDSALTLAIAVDALGADKVRAVMMPFRYTSQLSLDEAANQAAMLGVDYQVISIEPMYSQFELALADEFEGLPLDTTEQNIQARCRGVLLMAISNKRGALVLTTGNKSEVAVGYCTLYGDMAGGFDVLKDVMKTRVYALARYRNSLSKAIPEDVIERPPSAELAPDQKDEDSLPPYDVLDQILALYIEQDVSAADIVAQGFEKDQVHRVVRLVDMNEYKRRQAAIGPRTTQRGFGRDRRYPITNGWTIGD